MLNGSMNQPMQKAETSRIALIAGLGTAALLLGVVVIFGVIQLKSQKQQLAQMSEMVTQLAQIKNADQDVTRTASPDLITLAPAPAPQIIAQAPAPQPAPAVQAPTPAAAQTASPAALVQMAVAAGTAAQQPQPVSTPTQPAQNSTADKIRSLVTKAVAPASEITAEEQRRRDALKFETLAIIQAGVQELVTAVVEGKYDIHTNYEDEYFSGRIHFAFVGHEEDQTELERFLAEAAEKGMVAHSNAVVDGNGKVNGHILLFDLVERALENGTLEEQRAGAKMRREAQAMLAKDVDVGEPANAQGERFYVVEPGDSLAYIALQFYGNTNDFVRIFEANRSSISRPNQIRVGQRLLIPSA